MKQLFIFILLIACYSCQKELTFKRIEYQEIIPLIEGDSNSPALTYTSLIDWPETGTPELKMWVLNVNKKGIQPQDNFKADVRMAGKSYREINKYNYKEYPNKEDFNKTETYKKELISNNADIICMQYIKLKQNKITQKQLSCWSIKQNKEILYNDIFLKGQEYILKSMLADKLAFQWKNSKEGLKDAQRYIRRGQLSRDIALLPDGILFCCHIPIDKTGFVDIKLDYNDLLSTLTSYAISLLNLQEAPIKTQQSVSYSVGSNIPIINNSGNAFEITSAKITGTFNNSYSNGYEITYQISSKKAAIKKNKHSQHYLYIKLLSTKGQVITCTRLTTSQKEEKHTLHRYDYEGKSSLSHIEYITEEEYQSYISSQI